MLETWAANSLFYGSLLNAVGFKFIQAAITRDCHDQRMSHPRAIVAQITLIDEARQVRVEYCTKLSGDLPDCSQTPWQSHDLAELPRYCRSPHVRPHAWNTQ